MSVQVDGFDADDPVIGKLKEKMRYLVHPEKCQDCRYESERQTGHVMCMLNPALPFRVWADSSCNHFARKQDEEVISG